MYRICEWNSSFVAGYPRHMIFAVPAFPKCLFSLDAFYIILCRGDVLIRHNLFLLVFVWFRHDYVKAIPADSRN